MVRAERRKYLGHVLRSGPSETIHNVCFDSTYKIRTPSSKRRQKRPLDNWSRKTVQEVIDGAHKLPTHVVRPPPGVDPCTSGSLYAYRLAKDRTLWKRHIVGGIHAPARGGLSGACSLGEPPGALHPRWAHGTNE